MSRASTPRLRGTVGTVGTIVCRLDDIEVEGGVAALVDGHAVAVFRTYDGRVLALSCYDPVGGAAVLSRGIVGTRLVDGVDVPFVASPLHKQAYDLRTGRCLDDPSVRVRTYAVHVSDDGDVLVGVDEAADDAVESWESDES